MVSSTLSWWAWRRERGGSLGAKPAADSPNRSIEDPRGSFFRPFFSLFPPETAHREMTTSTTIDTDLVTPLQAYLHLRRHGRASFLLESVDQGRLGRHSFVGCGSRLVPLHEAEELAAPVVGYLAYDHIAQLEPTVPLPADGPDVPESLFIVADIFLRFDHVTGTAEVLYGDPNAVAALLSG